MQRWGQTSWAIPGPFKGRFAPSSHWTRDTVACGLLVGLCFVEFSDATASLDQGGSSPFLWPSPGSAAARSGCRPGRGQGHGGHVVSHRLTPVSWRPGPCGHNCSSWGRLLGAHGDLGRHGQGGRWVLMLLPCPQDYIPSIVPSRVITQGPCPVEPPTVPQTPFTQWRQNQTNPPLCGEHGPGPEPSHPSILLEGAWGPGLRH